MIVIKMIMILEINKRYIDINIEMTETKLRLELQVAISTDLN